MTDADLGSPLLFSSDGVTPVISSQAVFRFNPLNPTSPNLEKYQVTSESGKNYQVARFVLGNSYFFVGTFNFATSKMYRLNKDVLTDVKEFSVSSNPRANGPLHGTNWVLASLSSSTERKIYGYTSGFVSGTDSTVAVHTKAGGSEDERAFLSPEDGRDCYVAAPRVTKLFITVKVSDGSELLNYNLNTVLSSNAIDMIWVVDTDLLVAMGDSQKKLAIYDFMNPAKTRTVNVVTWATGIIFGQSNKFFKKRVFTVATSSSSTNLFFKIPVSDQPCSDLCSACHDVHRDRCTGCLPFSSLSGTTCACQDGYYEAKATTGYTIKECLACSVLCATCSGGASTNCFTCKDPNGELKGDGSCGCKDGYYLSGNTCQPCHSSCATCSAGGANLCLSCRPQGWFQVGSTCRGCDSSRASCSGPTANNCLSCAEAGFFLKSSTCTSCATETSTDCPTATTLTVRSEIQELSNILVLDFSPSLKPQFENANQASLLTVDNLLKNNLKITFGNSEDNQRDVTVTKTRMSHSGTAGNRRVLASTQTHSFVYITFLQNLRSNNSNYLKMSLKSPWIYKPTSRAQHQQTIYLSSGWTQDIKTSKKVKLEEEKRLESAKWLGKDFSGALAVLSAAPTVIAFILAWTTNFLGSLIRLFNVANMVLILGR